MTSPQLPIPTFSGITSKTYQIHGTMLGMGCTCSTCTCVSCGCFSLFDNMVGYRIEKGWIEGVDVSGVTLMRADYSRTDDTKVPTSHASGTILYIAEQATEQQQQALIRAFTGQLGGVLADLSHLLGHHPDIRIAPMHYRHENGQESLVVTDKEVVLEITREPRQGLARLLTQCFRHVSGQLSHYCQMAIAHLNADIFSHIRSESQGQPTLEAPQSSHPNQFCFEA